MGRIATIKGAEIVMRTRDHCDPHVHAIHQGEGWELRIYFSYVDTLVQAEIPALKGSPKNSQIQECMNAVTDELDQCRKMFWIAMQSVCLDNKYVQLTNGEIRAAGVGASGALRVRAARYIPGRKSVAFTAGKFEYIGTCP